MHVTLVEIAAQPELSLLLYPKAQRLNRVPQADQGSGRQADFKGYQCGSSVCIWKPSMLGAVMKDAVSLLPNTDTLVHNMPSCSGAMGGITQRMW